jgi:hypothetical protein
MAMWNEYERFHFPVPYEEKELWEELWEGLGGLYIFVRKGKGLPTG